MQDKKILFLYTGGHPLHLGFAKSLGADIQKLSWKVPKNYDIYLSEGEFFKTILLKKFGKIKKNSILINLFSDPRLFYYNEKIWFDAKNQKIKKLPNFKLNLFKKLLKKLDGVICVGKLEEKLLENFYNKPHKKVDIFVEKDWHSKLLEIKPNLNNKRIIFVGSGPDSYYKGMDLFLQIASELKGFEFLVIGECWERFIELNKNKIPENLKFVGKKNHEEIKEILNKGGVYLHLGRGEAFGIVIIEAMSAGIIPIVSELTGAKEAVEKVDKKLIVSLNKEEILKKISQIYNLNKETKGKISEMCKKIGKEFNEEKRLQEFKKNFWDLIEEIENGKK